MAIFEKYDDLKIRADYNGNKVLQIYGKPFAIVTDEFTANEVVKDYFTWKQDDYNEDDLRWENSRLEDEVTELEIEKDNLQDKIDDYNLIKDMIYYFKKIKNPTIDDYKKLIDDIDNKLGE